MKNLSALILLLSLITNKSLAQRLNSGYYDNGLSIVHNVQDQKYQCYLETYRGYKSEYSCSILFELRRDNKVYFLDNSGDNSIPAGNFSILSNKSVHIKFFKDIPDCKNASPLNFASGHTFNLSIAKKWNKLEKINIEHCLLFSNKTGSNTVGYLVKDDIVKVLSNESNRVYIEYENFMQKNHKPLFAWINRKDLL